MNKSKHSRRRAAVVAGVGGLVLLIASCAATPSVSSSDGALTPIRFVQEWPVADGFWIPWTVAVDQGFYKEAGLDVQIITPPNTSATMQYLGTGEADLAFTTSVDVITARAQGVPAVAIAKYGSNNNWGLISKGGAPVDPADLAGKLVGTYNDAWSNAQLSIMLGSVGKTINDVTLVTADSSTVPLLVQGQVDVITGITNAEGSELESLGVSDYSISYSRDYGAPDAPVFALAAQQDWLDEHPGAAKKFIEATLRGLNFARENPAEAVDIFMKTYPDAQSLEFTTLQWEATAALFGDPGAEVTAQTLTQSADSWASIADVALKYGLVDTAVPVDELYTNDVLGG